MANTNFDTALVENYRTAVNALEIAKSQYHGVTVFVDNDRYTGPGVVQLVGQCKPDEISVKLPNGNVWHYSIDTVTFPPHGQKGS